MRVRRSLLAAAVAAAALACAAASPAGERPQYAVGPPYVAPLRIPAHPHPGPVPGCIRPTAGCVVKEMRRLRAREAALGCDHRAVFATTYRVLTRMALQTVRRHPRYFRYPRYFFFEDALFAQVYFANSRAWAHGNRVSPAWRIAFEAARDGDQNAAQDMLLGINAHVQNDMPFVMAALGTHTSGGRARHRDHERMNRVLARAYRPVVDAVRRRYDGSMAFTNPDGVPVDDMAGLALVKKWRDDVWRNANRLLRARTTAERRQVTRDIEQNAATTAGAIATLQVPGYRAQRNAYCAAHNPDAGAR
jgi:hypothetical protein